jgi:hypothetical protein
VSFLGMLSEQGSDVRRQVASQNLTTCPAGADGLTASARARGDSYRG